MSKFQNRNGIAPALPSHAKLGAIGEEKLPDGRKVADVQPDEFRRIALAAGVPGITAGQGYAANAQAYSDHMGKIRKEGAEAAVAAWLEGNKA